MTSKKSQRATRDGASNVINLADRYFRAQCDRLGPITPYEKMLANSILNHAEDLRVCEEMRKAGVKKPRHAFKPRAPVPPAPKPRTEEEQAADTAAFLEWAKTQEARLCFSAVPVDPDNARGIAADREFEWPTPRTAADFDDVFKPTCRICGEEGHSWQRCGSD
jgi:hypothetical protein